MTVISGGSTRGANPKTAGDLTAVAAGTIGAHDATSFVVTLFNGTVITITGTGFTYNGTSPTGGTTTGLTGLRPGEVTATVWSGFSVPFATLWNICVTGDIAAYNNLLFAGNDTFIAHAGVGSEGSSFSGGDGNDTFDFQITSGYDTALGGAGADIFAFGAGFSASDQIDGGTNGASVDELQLNGDYSAGVIFDATTLTNVERLRLGSGYAYNLKTNDATVAAGATLYVRGSDTGDLTFDGSAETDGNFDITAGYGDKVITGGSGNDSFDLGADFSETDVINGGGGSNTVILDGDYSVFSHLYLNDGTLTNVQIITLKTGSFRVYGITTADGNVAAGTTLTVNGSALGSYHDYVNFDGRAETDGNFVLLGGTWTDSLYGGGGNDTLMGGNGADSLRPGLGTDTVSGGSGDDTISFTGGRFDAADMIDGGAGNDLLWLTGDYTGGVVMNAATLTNVESIAVAAGFNYSLTTADTTVGAGKQLSVDTTSLGVSNALTFNGSAETDGTFVLLTGAGADTLIGGGGGDTFRAGGGFDHVSGNGGDDAISFSLGHLDAADVIDGGTGTDLVWLNSYYTGSNAVTFNATTLTNVETIALAAAYSYSLTTADATVGADKQLTVDGSGLQSGRTLSFNGSAETDGTFLVIGGAGADTIIGGSGNDTLSGRAGNDTLRAGLGNDVAFGGDGDDSISFTNGKLNASDIVDGGAGWDTVWLNGDYTGANAVNFFASTMANVESIGFAAGFNYTLKTSDGTVASGKMLTIDASTLGASNALSFDGSAETNGTFTFVGGSGGDSFTGGSGADTFKYDGAGRSTGLHYDTIHALNFANDSFDIPGGVGVVTGIDAAKTTGALSTASFDTDLATALSALGAHHAILFTPNAGSLSGQTFMVIDCNGTAGYQSGQDLVIRLNGYSGALAAGAFH